MKKHLLSFAALILVSVGAMAQACVIDSTNTDLLSPPSETLPCIERNVPYSTVLQLFTPPSIGGVGVDSIVITSFNDMPSGITSACNPSNCTMVGFGRACITISGTTSDTVGAYLIDYDGIAYTEQGAAPFDYLRANFPGVIPDYTLFITEAGAFCANTGANSIHSNNQELQSAFSVYPNPSAGIFRFSLNHVSAMGGDIIVTDMAGRVVYSHKNTAGFFEPTTIDISQLAKGVYTLQYRTKEGIAAKKIFID
ncbi:MAG TPA: T9SS type A sorting domain-containing protein [Chitinophagales bacterium]|nr:T9SS type A sorting domain-containing protein [Chitinophagales bacterium]